MSILGKMDSGQRNRRLFIGGLVLFVLLMLGLSLFFANTGDKVRENGQSNNSGSSAKTSNPETLTPPLPAGYDTGGQAGLPSDPATVSVQNCSYLQANYPQFTDEDTLTLCQKLVAALSAENQGKAAKDYITAAAINTDSVVVKGSTASFQLDYYVNKQRSGSHSATFDGAVLTLDGKAL